MPFNGNGLTLGIIDGVMFAQDINPELLLPIHMEHPLPFMNPDIDKLKSEIECKHCLHFACKKLESIIK